MPANKCFKKQLYTYLTHSSKLVRHRSRLNCTQRTEIAAILVSSSLEDCRNPPWALRKCRVKEAKERARAAQAYNYWGFYTVIGRPYIRGGRGQEAGRPPRNRPRYAPVIASCCSSYSRGQGMGPSGSIGLMSSANSENPCALGMEERYFGPITDRSMHQIAAVRLM